MAKKGEVIGKIEGWTPDPEVCIAETNLQIANQGVLGTGLQDIYIYRTRKTCKHHWCDLKPEHVEFIVKKK